MPVTAAPLAEAVGMLLDRDYRALPVVDAANTLVGIVTNGDLVQRGGLSARMQLLVALQRPALERELASHRVQEKTVGDVMTREVVSVQPDEPLDRATHLMVERRIKRLPVVDPERRLLGMLSRIDVLRTMGEGYFSPEQEDEGEAAGAPDRGRGHASECTNRPGRSPAGRRPGCCHVIPDESRHHGRCRAARPSRGVRRGPAGPP
jgi:CBS domain-containing protein